MTEPSRVKAGYGWNPEGREPGMTVRLADSREGSNGTRRRRLRGYGRRRSSSRNWRSGRPVVWDMGLVRIGFGCSKGGQKLGRRLVRIWTKVRRRLASLTEGGDQRGSGGWAAGQALADCRKGNELKVGNTHCST